MKSIVGHQLLMIVIGVSLISTACVGTDGEDGDGLSDDGAVSTASAALETVAGIESITAYGKYYNFDTVNGWAPLPGNGSDLTSVPRYATGPCDGRPFGGCKFDTRSVRVDANGHRIESIIAYGKFYNFDIDNGYAPGPSNGSDLTSVSRYATGPCDGRPVGTCMFDTRTFARNIDGHLTESITAYGKYYNFDIDNGYAPWATNGDDLTSVSRYATGPCADRPVGGCTFDSRTIAVDSNSHQVESITAYGKYYNFDVENGYTVWNGPNGSDLTSVSRYADGPCAGVSPGNCVFDTRLHIQ